MLFFTRKEGDAIHISDDVIIRFNGIHKTQIKLAIEAPMDVSLTRSKVLGELQYE